MKDHSHVFRSWQKRTNYKIIIPAQQFNFYEIVTVKIRHSTLPLAITRFLSKAGQTAHRSRLARDAGQFPPNGTVLLKAGRLDSMKISLIKTAASYLHFIAPCVIPEVVRVGTSISESPLCSGSILGDGALLK